MTGWAAVVKGLTNELRAGDLFLGGSDGKMTIRLSHPETFSRSQVTAVGGPMWELFEVCRWMSARSEVWAEVFGSGLKEMLPPLKKVGLPGEWDKVVFVSSDATTTMVAAIDWKHGLVFREKVVDLEPWILRALDEEEQGKDEMAKLWKGSLSSPSPSSAAPLPPPQRRSCGGETRPPPMKLAVWPQLLSQNLWHRLRLRYIE